MGLITRQVAPNAKGSKLTFVEMDNNLYYLQSVGVSGVTYSANTLTLIDPTGGTKSVIIYSDTEFTGGTVTGSTNFTNGITSNVISATTYQNLPTDVNVTGGTYDGGVITFTNNTGGTFNVIGLFTGSTDVFITAATYNDLTNTITLTDNTNTSFSTYINAFSGVTVNGVLSATTISGGTLYGDGSNLLGISTQDTFVTGGTYNDGSVIFTNNTGGTFNVTGFYTGDTTTITGATNVGTGITIFDTIVDRNIQINSITGDSLQKITTSLSSNTINLGINEQNLELWSLVVQGNTLIDGGVSYVSGLTFDISILRYIINGVIYDLPSFTTVTLNSGDTTYDRIDVFYVDISGNTGVVEGTPSENPLKPNLDGDTQLEVSFVLVPANSTSIDLGQFIIYNENSGPPTEWTFGKVGLQQTRISGSSTDQAYSGTTSIRVSGVTGSFTTSFRLTGSSVLDTNQYATLQFAMKNLSANTTTSQIRIRFLTTGGTQNGNTVLMNAAGSAGYVQYSSTNTSSWQLISIPLWKFYLTNTNVQVVEFSFNSPNARYYFDLIEFIDGLSSSPPTNSWTTIKGDGTTTIVAPNPNSTLTISGGTNIGSFISGTSTVVLNLDNNIKLNGVTASTVSATTYQNLPTDIRVTGGTYSDGTLTFTNNTGGTFNVTGLVTGTTTTIGGNYLPLSGGTVTGDTIFTNGLTANTISATTYQNLPTDVRVTGATYFNNVFTHTNNTGGTYTVLFNTVTGLTVNGNLTVTGTTSSNTISATTLTVNGVNITGDTYVTGLTFNTGNYNLTIGRNDGVSFTDSLSVLASDLTITGGTYNPFTGVGTFTNNTGGTFNVSGFLVGYTDLLVTGATYNNNTFTFTNSSGGTFGVYFNNVTGLTSTGTIQSSIISATTYQNLPTDVNVTGGTYSNGTITFTNNTGGTFNVTGLVTGATTTIGGDYLPLSGGTVTGGTAFQSGLTANTISATTYQNLPIDVKVTGSSYNNNTFTFTNNTGGTFNVLFNTVTGLTSTGTIQSSVLSASTYQNLPTDVRVTGSTYSNNTFTFTNNTGGTFNVLFNTVTGLTVNGNLTVTGTTSSNTISATTYQNLPVTADTFTTGFTYSSNTLTINRNQGLNPLTATINTVTGLTSTGTISSNTISATTYQNLPVTADTFVTGYTYSNNTFTINRNQNLSPLTATINTVTGLTVNGDLTVTGTTSSNVISATTYQNLPIDIRVTGASYSNNVFTHTNNTGGTYTVLFNTVTGLTVNGNLTVTGTTSSSTISATTYQNLPTDVRVTGASYSNNTFTYTNNTGGTFNVLFNNVTGLTVNGNLTVTGTTSSNTISATTYQNLPTDIRVTGGTYSSGTATFRNNTGGTFNVTGFTTGVTITNNVNNYLLTATGTENSINGESNATFDGTTLSLIKNSTSPNLIISDTGSSLNDAYIRIVATSAASPTYAIGVDKSDADVSLKIIHNAGSAASPSLGNIRMEFTTGGTVNIPQDGSPMLTMGSVKQVEISTSSLASELKLKNGNTGTLDSRFTQFNSYSSIVGNVGNTVASEPFYVNNDSISGQTIFQCNNKDIMVLNPTGTTSVISGAGVSIKYNLQVDGYVAVGQITGTGNALYRNSTTGVLTTTSSDSRLKQNVEQITNALDIVNNLRGVYYNWKDNEDFNSGDSSRQIGLIAQEVEPHLPEAVVYNGLKDYKTIKYSEMVSVLVEAIKEQQQQINSLKQEIINLKNNI